MNSKLMKRLRYFFRYQVAGRKRIFLAVVGTTSSGKSFLLNDILTSLGSMSAVFTPLSEFPMKGMPAGTLMPLKDLATYSPDEYGGSGGTPIYACRQSNFYGAAVRYNNSRDVHDLVFLNIPGEIFSKAENGALSRLQAYIMLKSRIAQLKKRFYVSRWVNSAGDERLIVQPVVPNPASTSPMDSPMSASPQLPTIKGALQMRYRDWNEIFSDLNASGFRFVEKSRRKINGRKLLKSFFFYDTDSIMMTINDMIETGQLQELPFTATDFRGRLYDNAFTFFHFCALASDIVLCDRIFTKREANTDEMLFGDLADGLQSFLDDCTEDKKNVYLAFRNVDFLMLEKEKEYQKLYNETLSSLSTEGRRNAIYSLFSYAMLHHVDPTLNIPEKEFADFIGLPAEMSEAAKKAIPSDPAAITDLMVDLDGADGHIHMAASLRNHISTRIGGEGHAFRKLLQKTGYAPEQTSDARSRIVPHVYFTCTPITQNYEIYQNYLEGDKVASDFSREVDGYVYKFHEQFSHACFGSYQLCMDILTQHRLGDFEKGSLLMIEEEEV